LVEYNFSEVADSVWAKFDYKTESIKFSAKMRFIHLLEEGGRYNEECFEEEEIITKKEEHKESGGGDSSIKLDGGFNFDCIEKKDCVETNKKYRYAFYTSDGWYVYSGDGFWKYEKERWLKWQSGCDFIAVKCNSGCGASCSCSAESYCDGGCDCESLQDKLSILKFDLQDDLEIKYQDILTKINNFDAPETNLELLVNLINDVKKGILVLLRDGDDNTLLTNNTTDILILLSELRGLIAQMKYCENPELTKELQDLVASVSAELRARRSIDIKKEYPELANYFGIKEDVESEEDAEEDEPKDETMYESPINLPPLATDNSEKLLSDNFLYPFEETVSAPVDLPIQFI
jgi:hypothetical protein